MSNLFKDQVTHDNIYTSTYSLWGNSKYYDIKNLSPQNYCASLNNGSSANVDTSLFSWSPREQAPPTRDCLNRRIISRDSLYEDPDNHVVAVNDEIHKRTSVLLHNSPPEGPKNRLDKATVFDWTQFYWHKATEKLGEQEWGQGTSKLRRQVVGSNKIQKKLNKMLAKPATMTKAESMMQKMGWQGGALGRTGDGIVEPITPNAVYAQTKIGFGHSLVQTNQAINPVRPIPSKVANIEFFDMNVLKHVYDFINNNTEKELLFDKKLNKHERKRIHHIIGIIDMCDDVSNLDYERDTQIEQLVFQIEQKNGYYLHTESSGGQNNRQLCLYKLAPPHVYLIIPEDLKTEKKDLQTEIHEITKTPIKTGILAPEPKVEEAEVEEETNPFLISITRNLKKQKTDSDVSKVHVPQNPEFPEDPKVSEVPAVLPAKLKISTKIVEHFMDFAQNKDFTEFKFMGPFNEEQFDAINEFLAQAVAYSSKVGDCHLVSIFDKVHFRIEEDRTGNTVICKTRL